MDNLIGLKQDNELKEQQIRKRLLAQIEVGLGTGGTEFYIKHYAIFMKIIKKKGWFGRTL